MAKRVLALLGTCAAVLVLVVCAPSSPRPGHRAMPLHAEAPGASSLPARLADAPHEALMAVASEPALDDDNGEFQDDDGVATLTTLVTCPPPPARAGPGPAAPLARLVSHTAPIRSPRAPPAIRQHA